MENETKLYLRVKDEDLVPMLTKIAEEKNVSLNKLCCDILKRYAIVSDKYTLEAVPIIVQSMIKEELSSISSVSNDVLKDIYITIIKLRKITETMVTFLLPEFNEAEYDSLKTSELLQLLNAMDDEK
ncbi:MAG: hypothetical protein IJ571_00525 [Ruminococcus sp.]|nr:hypothetical protein [Ruminococcus sp.]